MFFAVTGLVSGLVFANAVIASPEICGLVPTLISPETCVAVQNGKVGTLIYVASTAGGLFSGAVLGGALSIFYIAASNIMGVNQRMDDMRSRFNNHRRTFR